ncbi:MAG: transposase [Candidatus Omnitrophota bacterium]|jgi:REP element-mobilizing transposase RayT
MLKQRKPNRLKNYDYSQGGAYFITICSHNRDYLFGEIADGKMRLNEYGGIVENEWIKSPEIRAEIKLDEYIVMPNHIHGIILIENPDVGGNGRSPLPQNPIRRTSMGSKTLSSFVAGYKSAVTKQINGFRHLLGVPVWQRSYYDHIIRDELSLERVREYIVNNPKQWDMDEENIKNAGSISINRETFYRRIKLPV